MSNIKEPTKEDKIILLEGTEEEIKLVIAKIEEICSNPLNFSYSLALKRELN